MAERGHPSRITSKPIEKHCTGLRDYHLKHMSVVKSKDRVDKRGFWKVTGVNPKTETES
jgi:hypothetical protein